MHTAILFSWPILLNTSIDIVAQHMVQFWILVDTVLLSALIAYNFRSAQSLRIQAQHKSVETLRFSHDLQQAKSNFLATVGHELRGPVQAISHFTLSLKNALPVTSHNGLNKIDENVATISELLDSMVKLSHSEWQATNPSLEEISLYEIMAVLQAEFSAKAAEKDLQLQFEATQCSLYSDKVCLSQILRNLIGNAIKYTERGHVKVSVEEDADSVSIVIEDTGCGITSQELPNIFEEFYQIRQTGRDRGVGLGLSIVARLAKQLGIDITVSSKYLVGTSFEVKIEKSSIETEPAQEGRLTTGARVTASLGGIEMLVVNHGDPAVDSLGDLLDDWGGDVCRLASFSEAVEHIAKNNVAPDLILTDSVSYQALEKTLDPKQIDQLFADDTPVLITVSDEIDFSQNEIVRESHIVVNASIEPMKFRSLIQRNVELHAMSF